MQILFNKLNGNSSCMTFYLLRDQDVPSTFSYRLYALITVQFLPYFNRAMIITIMLTYFQPTAHLPSF